MNLEEAEEKFCRLLEEIHPSHVAEFLLQVQRRHLVATCSGTHIAEAVHKLDRIAAHVRELVPHNAILPSENIVWPTGGGAANCNPETTVHVDAFLYSDDEIDALVEAGKLSRNYCVACNSRNTAPLSFVSHSASRRRAQFVFRELVPYLKDKSVLDVGSRLGVFLYAAHAFTPADPIVGVEMNADLCALQERVVRHFGMEDRIRVIHADVRDVPESVASSDVVILNNVFEFFVPESERATLWRFLRRNVKKGAVLVTVPRLETSLSRLNVSPRAGGGGRSLVSSSQTGIDPSEWVRERYVTDPLSYAFMEDHEELSEVAAYDVL